MLRASDAARAVHPRGARLLPISLILMVGTSFVSHLVFVPAPMGGDRRPSVPASSGSLGQMQATEVAAMAGLFSTVALAGPALAATGNGVPGLADGALAHGAIGNIEPEVLQGYLEKMVFGGLLASTVAAWWRGTIGNARAETESGKPWSFWALGFSCLSLVLVLSERWYDSGHFPLSNMYESLMFLAWGITAITLYFMSGQLEQPINSLMTKAAISQRKATVDIAAVWASPVTLGIVAFATLTLPKELQKAGALVPALQSNWLVMHVSVVMLSYSTLMFGSVLCMAVIALSQPKDSPISAIRDGLIPALRGLADGLVPPQPVVATSAGGVPASDLETSVTEAPQVSAMTATMPGAAQTMEVAAKSGGSVTIEFSGSSGKQANLSDQDSLTMTLDDLAYRSLLLGFGFLTVGIISGAVWANEAWGNYWSWDPKETWALITWLIYAAYLHTRMQLGWDTRDSAKIGAFGFIVVWICYIGVNLLGIGLHSYGFFLK